MKIIADNNVELVDVDGTTAPGFLLSNALNDHLEKPWKGVSTAEETTQTVNFTIVGASNAFAAYGLDGSAITVNLYSDSEKSTLISTKTVTLKTTGDFGAEQQTTLWMEYVEQSTTVYGTLILTNDDNLPPKIGIVSGGLAVTLRNPKWGMSKDFTNNGIKKKLKNGASFTRNKNFVNKFSGEFIIPVRNNGLILYESLERFFKRMGYNPFACLLIDNVKDSDNNSLDDFNTDWVAFESMTPTRGQFSHSTISFSLEQYL